MRLTPPLHAWCQSCLCIHSRPLSCTRAWSTLPARMVYHACVCTLVVLTPAGSIPPLLGRPQSCSVNTTPAQLTPPLLLHSTPPLYAGVVNHACSRAVDCTPAWSTPHLCARDQTCLHRLDLPNPCLVNPIPAHMVDPACTHMWSTPPLLIRPHPCLVDPTTAPLTQPLLSQPHYCVLARSTLPVSMHGRFCLVDPTPAWMIPPLRMHS